MNPSEWMSNHGGGPLVEQKKFFDVMEFLKAIILTEENYQKLGNNSVLFCDDNNCNRLQLDAASLPDEYREHFYRHWPRFHSIGLIVQTSLHPLMHNNMLLRAYEGKFQLTVVSHENTSLGLRYIFCENFSDLQAREMHELLEKSFHQSRQHAQINLSNQFGHTLFTPFFAKEILQIEIKERRS